MYKAWSASAEDGAALAQRLEAHLNEFAAEVIAVSYAVAGSHHVLAVYRELRADDEMPAEAAVAAAEHIIDGMQP